MKNVTTEHFSCFFDSPIAKKFALRYIATFNKFFSDIEEIEKDLITKHAEIILANTSYSKKVQGPKLEKAMPNFLQLLNDTIENDKLTPIWVTGHFLENEICFFPVSKLTPKANLELMNFQFLFMKVDDVLTAFLNER